MVDKDDNELLELNNKSSSKLRRLAIGLVVLSFALYGGILLVAFLPYSTGIKVSISTTLAVLGEISFWVGGFILGKEAISRYKRYLNPLCWFKRQS